jgi:uncharacterized membrane protein
MAIGPVQLIVLGFEQPDFHGEIIDELERLKESGTVRVIDALAVYKDAQGDVEVEHLSNLTQDEAIELGSVVGALVGLGIEGEAGFEAGAAAGAEAAAAEGVHAFSDEEAWDVIEEIPNDSAAALILLEHQWAATRSRAPEASGSATASSARSTWSRSDCTPPRRRKRSTQWKRRAPRPPRQRGGDEMIGCRRVARRTSRRTSRRVSRR